MAKIQTMSEFIAYLVGSNHPEELKTAVTNDMQAVEEVNQGGATAYLVIAVLETRRTISQAIIRG